MENIYILDRNVANWFCNTGVLPFNKRIFTELHFDVLHVHLCYTA